MGVFIDTGFFLGLLHHQDPNHEQCKQQFLKVSTGEFGLIFTSSYVISETATLILLRTHNNLTTLNAFWNFLYGDQKFVQIFHSTSYINQMSWMVFLTHNQKVKDKRNYLSFVDASNIAICREKEIPNILAVDTDFDSYLTRIQ